METPHPIILAEDLPPEELVLFPTSERPVFPGMVAPLMFAQAPSPEAQEFIAKNKNNWVGLIELTHGFAASHGNEGSYKQALKAEDFRPVGCAGRVLKMGPTPDGGFQMLVNVQRRISLTRIVTNDPHLIGAVVYHAESVDVNDPQVKALIQALISKIKELIKLNAVFSEEMKLFISRFGSNAPGQLTDMVASMLSTITAEELQGVLETLEPLERIQKVLHFVHREVEVNLVKERINKQIEEKASKQQRDFFLNEQLKIIKKELGLEKDEKSADLDKIREKVSKLKLTPEAQKVVNEELEKLKLYDERSAEYGVLRNYLQWIISLPWGIYTEDQLDLPRVMKTLNQDHYGIQEVKDRILEFVAVQKLKKSVGGSILCFVGPPGVGKTSLGKSIAHAIGRKFYNFSLGGMRDEAEIKGHRRTYIGAMPGKIVQALKSCESANPVLMLDEIDKLGISHQGDPASALLEVLDPEQNHAFLDHYLDLRFDLSRVLFICTANTADTIPPPLLDRMEVITLSGYILEEKVQIARRFIIPKALAAHGLEASDLQVDEGALESIIRHYARESGVRSLEQQMRKLCRKVAREKASGNSAMLTVTRENLRKYLGPLRFTEDSPYETIVPGIVTGLAWTSLGGSTLYIESLLVREDAGKGFLKITGQLGKVMEESAQIAWSYVSSIAPAWGIKPSFFQDAQVHLHVPAGATPKDGPSAGITMALSLFSLAIGRPVPHDLAMTGELTASGYVLPIGGVREKLVAAKRALKKRILLPDENRRDYEELPATVRRGLKVSFVKRFEQVVASAFPKIRRARPASKKKPGGSRA
jgi:ATP-dependent Lon protease